MPTSATLILIFLFLLCVCAGYIVLLLCRWEYRMKRIEKLPTLRQIELNTLI